MFKLIIYSTGWLLIVWYIYDSYKDLKSLNHSVIEMFHYIKVGICEKRRSIKEIISFEEIFESNGAKDFSMFLWENHERLGLNSDLIDTYNAFTKESEFGDGQVCEDRITAIEREFKNALMENQSQIKSKLISLVTICTAIFAVVVIFSV